MWARGRKRSEPRNRLLFPATLQVALDPAHPLTLRSASGVQGQRAGVPNGFVLYRFLARAVALPPPPDTVQTPFQIDKEQKAFLRAAQRLNSMDDRLINAVGGGGGDGDGGSGDGDSGREGGGYEEKEGGAVPSVGVPPVRPPLTPSPTHPPTHPPAHLPMYPVCCTRSSSTRQPARPPAAGGRLPSCV